jgi:DNA topoisomerase-1
MAKPLVIVESPAKAKTIGQFLGSDFTVMASIGHVVDLPSSGLCVDTENNFELTYEVTKKDVVRDLKDALKKSSALYLATDEDREGEAIAWHLHEQLKPRVPVKRMVFHEITKGAIAHALEASRDIDRSLVDAQEARRTLDRLFGYEVSPVLWRKVKGGLSAGRVQSPSIRLIVERERERMRFHSVSYWDLGAKHSTSPAFASSLLEIDGKRVAAGKDFDENGKPTRDVVVLDEAQAKALVERLGGVPFIVRSVEERPSRSSPKPPFMTSTLQQEAGRKLNMSAQQVMRVAQGLYERGYITYMRTDSTNLSETAIKASRAQVTELFGQEFLPAEPRTYAKKSKNSQEAHEAVRPAGEVFRSTEELKSELNGTELKLYDLIWKRTLASQMNDAIGVSVSARVGAKTSKEDVVFSASGRTLKFHGYLRAYVEGSDDPDTELDDRETALPQLKEGETVPVESIEAKGHTTTPPARYTEASLVKRLEELGIGRPSTYASIMGTLQAKYVWKKGQALIPVWVAFAVVNVMEGHFAGLVDYAFTARMEDDLDEIAAGKQDKVPYLKEFYWGNKKIGLVGLHQQVEENIADIDAAAVNTIPIGKDPKGNEVIVKPGRYGPYLKRGEDTVSVPENLAPDEMTIDRAMELLSAPRGDVPIGVDPVSGKNVYAKNGRFGAYVQLGEMPIPNGKKGKIDPADKPKTASLFHDMKLDGLKLEQALQLLELPRVVGVVDEKEVVASNGRYGPYLKWGTETRNMGVDNESKLFTITLDEAMAILKQPKQFRGRGQAKPPLASFPPDPVSGKPVVLKEGRFGFYVTDGETNASLRRGDEVADLTAERAYELMELRREYIASGQGKPAKKVKKPAAKGKGAKEPKPDAVEKPAAKPAKAAPAKVAKIEKAQKKAARKSVAKKPAKKKSRAAASR